MNFGSFSCETSNRERESGSRPFLRASWKKWENNRTKYLPGSLFHPSVVAVGTKRRWLAVNRIIRITADTFFHSLFFSFFPLHSSITLKTMLRAFNRLQERIVARHKPSETGKLHFYTFWRDLATLSLSLSPSLWITRAGRSTDRQRNNADFSSVDSTTLIAPVI